MAVSRTAQAHVDDDDDNWMALALHIASAGAGQTSPNPLVGCVLVNQGCVVGQGAHLRAGGPHAEVHALRMAGDAAHGATAYVTLEPCSHHGRTPPCADALVAAGVQRVVIGSVDPDPRVSGRGIQRLQEAGIDVRTGVLAAAADRQNEAFFTWVTQGRPFVVWKTAQTLDGYIATETGHSQYVTGPEARAEVQRLRREVAAIAVGVGTVLADNPRLTVHASAGKQPVRVIFDSRLRLPESARLLSEPGETVLYHTAQASSAANRTLSAKLNVTCVEVRETAAGQVSVVDALHHLGQRGVNYLLLEGGPTLASEFLRQRLIDRAQVWIAPKLLGGGMPTLHGLQPAVMTEAIRLQDPVLTQSGEDFCVTGRLAYPTL